MNRDFHTSAATPSDRLPLTTGIATSADAPAAGRANERLLLVGTAGSLHALAAGLRTIGPLTPTVLGAVLIDEGDDALSSQPDLPVLGMLEDVDDLASLLGASGAILSLPSAMTAAIARARAALERAGLLVRWAPTPTDLIRGGIPHLAGIGTLDAPALIGREPRQLDEGPVRRLIEGKRVLITGAGGSIGSELARRCAALNPKAIILLERAENALFEIDRQIAAQFPALERKAVLHDVVDDAGTLKRFLALRPDVVFHAAAHKHVPMMEDHPAAAVNNNVFGTRSVADAAKSVGTGHFVMVSTDKAVNPTSVMGATKRLAELYVRSLNEPENPGATRFTVVRFGNVLGSACSVLPIWGAQIAAGGPLTITHPEMTRYFMTIPEAAALVVQSAAIPAGPDGVGPDVFVLDMGQPVLIRDLAERFIRAQGLEPAWQGPDAGSGPDHARRLAPNRIRVVFSGVRPGEKLHEELAYEAETLLPTPVPGILAWRGETPKSSELSRILIDLSRIRSISDISPVNDVLRRCIPELKSVGSEPNPRELAA